MAVPSSLNSRSQFLRNAFPHFEELCRVWARRYATAAEVGVELGSVGRHLANDARRREAFELDVVVCAPGEGEVSGPRVRPSVHAIGEAKLSRLLLADLDRLDRLEALRPFLRSSSLHRV